MEDDQPSPPGDDVKTGVLDLPPEVSERCGHLAGEGSGGSPEETAARREIAALAQDAADTLGRSVEVYATNHDRDGWQVEQIHPRGW